MLAADRSISCNSAGQGGAEAQHASTMLRHCYWYRRIKHTKLHHQGGLELSIARLAGHARQDHEIKHAL
jgi:hypothetical protein